MSLKKGDARKSFRNQDLHFLIDAELSIEEKQKVINGAVKEIVETTLEKARTSGEDFTLGVLLQADSMFFKLRRCSYVDCDYLDCKMWGTFTTCALPDFEKCPGYSRKAGERRKKPSEGYRFGKVLKLNP